MCLGPLRLLWHTRVELVSYRVETFLTVLEAAEQQCLMRVCLLAQNLHSLVVSFSGGSYERNSYFIKELIPLRRFLASWPNTFHTLILGIKISVYEFGWVEQKHSGYIQMKRTFSVRRKEIHCIINWHSSFEEGYSFYYFYS